MGNKKVLKDAIFAGICLAFGAFASAGLANPINGIVFSAGLVMIVLLQLQLFTGNMLRVKYGFSFELIFKYWILVYIGNFVGCFLTAILIFHSGINSESAINIGVYKSNLPFMDAFIRGIFCNMLVCIAVYLAKKVPEITAGKILSIMIPITIFVVCGFEHSIANMFYFTIAKTNFINLIPVTLGNIIGGLIIAFCTLDKDIKTDKIKISVVNEQENNTIKIK